MPNARTVVSATFQDAIEMMRGVRRSNLIIRFAYRNYEDDDVNVKSTKASTLYRDWYSECNICPPNDTDIYRLHILISPICTAIDIKEPVHFEQLMDSLEEVTVGHPHHE